MNYSIISSKLNGNTGLLTDEIYNFLKEDQCLFKGLVKDYNDNFNEDIVFVGFWTNRGMCDNDTLKLLNEIKNKKIFLFGSCGFGSSEKYFNGIIEKTKEIIDKSNEVIGTFICQGKMDLIVRKKYEMMLEKNSEDKKAKMLIENFDNALSHPDNQDISNLKTKINEAINNIH